MYLFLCVYLQTEIRVFKVYFEVMAPSLVRGFSAQVGTCFTVNNDTVLPDSANIFTRSLTFVLASIRTFCNKTHSSLGNRSRLLPDQYDGWSLQSCRHLPIFECGTFSYLEVVP